VSEVLGEVAAVTKRLVLVVVYVSTTVAAEQMEVSASTGIRDKNVVFIFVILGLADVSAVVC